MNSPTEQIEQALKSMITLIGDDPERDGLSGSPARFLKAMKEMTSGYEDDPAKILSVQFEQKYDELIILRNIEFTSLCEHHFLPFTGTATVGYIPNMAPGCKSKVVGLSKLARLVDCYSRRFQIQERMTSEIADALETNLTPAGIGVIVKAVHECMSCRGVRKQNADMITSVFRGVLRGTPEARAEFLMLTKG